MNIIIVFISLILSFNQFNQAHASSETEIIQIEGKITKVLFPQDEENISDQLCLSFFETTNGPFILVEDVYSCTYARRFKHKIGSVVSFNEPVSSFYADHQFEMALSNRFNLKKMFFFGAE